MSQPFPEVGMGAEQMWGRVTLGTHGGCAGGHQEAAMARENRPGRMKQPGPVTGKGGRARPLGSQGDSCTLPVRVCSVRSVDGSPTTAFTVLECEGSRRLGSRPRRYLLTGQANGSLAMWDLTTAMDGLGQTPGMPHLSFIPSPTDSLNPSPQPPSSRSPSPCPCPLTSFSALQPFLAQAFQPPLP